LDSKEKGLQPASNKLIPLRQKLINIDIISLVFMAGLVKMALSKGFFDLTDIPYVGSGVLASAAGFDKVITSSFLRRQDFQLQNITGSTAFFGKKTKQKS